MLAVRCCASGREQLHLLSGGEGPFFYALSAALAVQVQASGCAGSTRPAPPVASPAAYLSVLQKPPSPLLLLLLSLGPFVNPWCFRQLLWCPVGCWRWPELSFITLHLQTPLVQKNVLCRAGSC